MPGRASSAILTVRECRARERANRMKALQPTDGRIHDAGGAAELLGITAEASLNARHWLDR
jgi:hypothetical protein